MAQLKITPAQAQAFVDARRLSGHSRKMEKRRLMAQIRSQHPGIPRSTRIKLFVENPDNPFYCVIRDKRTGVPLDDGQPATDLVRIGTTAPAETVNTPPAAPLKAQKAPKAAKPAAKVAAKPAKKTSAVPKPAAKVVAKVKAAKPAAKAVAAKPATKLANGKTALVSKSAKPATKVAAKVAAKAVKPSVYPKQVRITVDGKRIRLGMAKNAAEEQTMLKQAND